MPHLTQRKTGLALSNWAPVTLLGVDGHGESVPLGGARAHEARAAQLLAAHGLDNRQSGMRGASIACTALPRACCHVCCHLRAVVAPP